jgi:hypothetical protein
MLDLSHETALSEQLWNTLESRTVLPESLQGYLQKQGGDVVLAGCQRRYIRTPLRKTAIALVGDQRHACFAKDLSRMGIGFYAPINLLPRQLLQLWLPNGKVVPLRVTRCRRIDVSCYEIGTIFAANSEKKPK